MTLLLHPELQQFLSNTSHCEIWHTNSRKISLPFHWGYWIMSWTSGFFTVGQRARLRKGNLQVSLGPNVHINCCQRCPGGGGGGFSGTWNWALRSLFHSQSKLTNINDWYTQNINPKSKHDCSWHMSSPWPSATWICCTCHPTELCFWL